MYIGHTTQIRGVNITAIKNKKLYIYNTFISSGSTNNVEYFHI